MNRATVGREAWLRLIGPLEALSKLFTPDIVLIDAGSHAHLRFALIKTQKAF